MIYCENREVYAVNGLGLNNLDLILVISFLILLIYNALFGAKLLQELFRLSLTHSLTLSPTFVVSFISLKITVEK